MWQGRFAGKTDEWMNTFNRSLSFDKRLYKEDITSSLVHAENLYRQKILTTAEYKSVRLELKAIEDAITNDKVKFIAEDEDIHMAIERLLTEKLGEAGARLHTARSRNDQVITDMRLYLKKAAVKQAEQIKNILKTFLELAEKHQDVILPGFTHLQSAQAISLSYYWLAYFFMLERDLQRLADCYNRFDKSPLGSGAFAGVNYATDREWLADKLGFAGVMENAMDAISDRDFLIEYLSFASIAMMHLSRLSEEIILWSSKQFDFIALDDGFTTGSSIMPNKKNPDAFELVRGKTGRVYGSLLGLLTVMKGLPLAYNKDLQEDKEGVFDAIDQCEMCFEIVLRAVASMQVKADNMRAACETGYLQATDMADYLVHKGLPFRQAHEVVGRIVRFLEERQLLFADATLEQYQKFSPLFEKDIYQCLKLEHLLSNKKSSGSTSPKSVIEQIQIAKSLLRQHAKKW